jgi:hypothetical protein
VPALAVVEDLQVLEQGVGQLDPGALPFPVEQLGLNPAAEGFDHRIVVTVADGVERARGVPRGHVQCVPKWRTILMFAQVRVVPATICKIVDDSLPRFESWTCHQKPQVKLGARTGALRSRGAVPGTADAACADEKPPCRQQQDTR